MVKMYIMRGQLFILLLLAFVVSFSNVEARLKNCIKKLPVSITTNIPNRIHQSINKPFKLKFKAKVKEELEGPFELQIDLRKEWFQGFWSVVPCVSFGYEHCKMRVTPDMIRNHGYSYPITRQLYKTRTDVDLHQIPDFMLKGNYRITLVLYTHTPHKRLVACVTGFVNVNIG